MDWGRTPRVPFDWMARPPPPQQQQQQMVDVPVPSLRGFFPRDRAAYDEFLTIIPAINNAIRDLSQGRLSQVTKQMLGDKITEYESYYNRSNSMLLTLLRIDQRNLRDVYSECIRRLKYIYSHWR